MREFIKITEKQKILAILYDFTDIFPHLFEKIESIEQYADKLSQYANFYLGIEDDTHFGIVVFYANNTDTKTAYISLIGIKENTQKKGLGCWLLSQCEEKSRQSGMTSIMLEVDSDNESAICFYKKNGYVTGEKTLRNSMYMHKQFA